ncbi:DUF5107 domain-containing protein [Hydrogenoanaerobacterium sp.]|uniref:DUF5107 domain-containing protein n=1 Tax=Hydrogenoanaerobacterium sp. TaxID=2953763 RepID=UPI0028982830|nr:DUF5107 domain-containing protein [Hydrogenoanaerobacterium sp.]
MVQIEPFQNTTAIVLQNSLLRIAVLPAKGGKLASVYSKPKEFELLFQNPKPQYGEAKLYSPFGQFEACGFDDAFPTINAGDVSVGGKRISYPDHGEIWSSKFDYRIEQERVELCFQSEILPYRYIKNIWLDGDSVICSYEITNIGRVEFPYLWAFHCLVSYREDMRLLMPEGVERVENVCASPLFGEVGEIYRYPVDTVMGGQNWDFRSVLPAHPKSMAKYYVQGAVKQGFCGYEYPSENVRALITYDAEKLPYLGFWITTGGYRGDCNCALEPATGYYDSIATAQKNGCCSGLQPGETLRFEIKITLQ